VADATKLFGPDPDRPVGHTLGYKMRRLATVVDAIEDDLALQWSDAISTIDSSELASSITRPSGTNFELHPPIDCRSERSANRS
jgi:hypothetical protein